MRVQELGNTGKLVARAAVTDETWQLASPERHGFHLVCQECQVSQECLYESFKLQICQVMLHHSAVRCIE